jgi:hypothetical protein
MKLILTDGYAFPWPQDLSQAEADRLCDEAHERSLTLEGVKAFEMKYTVTVEFDDVPSYFAAKVSTGWAEWDRDGLILEATTSAKEGNEFPALVANGFAWCGIYLSEDQ